MRYVVKSAPPPGGEPDEFVMSDNSVDRMGDVVEASGWQLDRIKSPPPVLFNHNRDQIIGSWIDIRQVGNQLVGRIAWTKSDKWPMGQYIRDLVREGILRTVSVGFAPVERQPLTKDASKEFGPWRFTKSELLECSLVAIPANPNAMAVARSLHLPSEFVAEVFGESARSSAIKPGKPAKSLVPRGATHMTTLSLSQKIQAAQKRIVGLRDELTDLVSKDDLTDEEKKYSDELPDLIEAEQNELSALERKEKSLAVRIGTPPPAQPAQEIIAPASPAFSMPKKKIEPVEYTWRAMVVALRSFASQTNPEQVLRNLYGNDEGTQIILRAAVNPAMTGTAGYAAELVQIAYGGFLDRLIANSLYGPLSETGMRIDFGSNGVVKIPTRTSASKAAGAWVGEGSPKPVKKISLAPITMTPTKLAVITTFTEEMAFYSTPAIQGILQKAMTDDTQESIDGFLIDNVAASASRPAGLLNGVTPVTASVAATTVQKVIDDLNSLIKPMEAVGGGGKIVLMVNPAQARSLTMVTTTTGDFVFDGLAQAAAKFGISRIVSSRTVPVGQVIAVDAEWFATATGDTPRFAVSNEATLHEEDTTPLALGTTGTPNVVAAPMRSLFQTDSIAIRLSIYVTWAMTRASMVQTITAVGW
jgi:HK97 family phage major capsid protein/HK97 family phage prohead protease